MLRVAKTFAPLAALVICIAWVQFDVIADPGHLTAQWDNLDGGNPLRLQAARQWLSGELPLWNPYKRTGMPLLADTTAGAIYPGNIPFLFGDWGAPFAAMDVVAVVHFLIAGMTMYAFLRARELSRAASAVGGFVYSCNGTMIWYAAHYIQMQNSMAWLPLVLLAVHCAATRDTYWRWVATGGLAVALQFFAGYPEYSFYTGILAIGYSLSLVRQTSWLRPLAAVGGVYVCGLLLAAVQLIPSIELQSLSHRELELPLAVFQSMPAAPWAILQWPIPPVTPPFSESPPVGAYHVGSAAVLLIFFTISRQRGRGVTFLWITLILGYLLAIGSATPINGWAYHLPGLAAFRHPFKHLLEVNFAIAALAATGFDIAFRISRTTARNTAVIATLLVTFACLSPTLSPDQLSFDDALFLAVGSAALGAVAVFSAIVSRQRPLALVVVLASLAVTYRLNEQAFASGAFPEAVKETHRPKILDFLEPGWRVAVRRQWDHIRSAEVLLGDYPSEFNVFGVSGAGPYLWRPLAQTTGMIEEEIAFRKGIFEARDLTFPVLSCRYVVATWYIDRFIPPLDPPVYTPLLETDLIRLVERKDALPRFRLVDAVKCTDQPTLDLILSTGGFDLSRLALVDCANGYRPRAPFAMPPAAELAVAEERPRKITFHASIPDGHRGFLVVSQSDYPGWRSYINGEESPVHRVYGAVQGVELPGGRSEIVLAYAPMSFRLGAVTSGVSAFLLGALCIAEIRTRRRHQRGIDH